MNVTTTEDRIRFARDRIAERRKLAADLEAMANKAENEGAPSDRVAAARLDAANARLHADAQETLLQVLFP